jgi:hypothetical protein
MPQIFVSFSAGDSVAINALKTSLEGDMTDYKRRIERPRSKLSPNSKRQIDGALSYRIPEVCKITGLGRTMIYEAFKNKTLIRTKVGRCTIVLAEHLHAFLRSHGEDG